MDPEGLPLEVALVNTSQRGGLPAAVFEIDALDWPRVESSGLLHVDRARAGGSSPSFDETKPVQIDVVLDPSAAINAGTRATDCYYCGAALLCPGLGSLVVAPASSAGWMVR